MNIYITEAMLKRVIAAVESEARNDAGQSQAPYLYSAEDTQEWKDAQYLREQLKKKSTDVDGLIDYEQMIHDGLFQAAIQGTATSAPTGSTSKYIANRAMSIAEEAIKMRRERLNQIKEAK